MEKKKVDTKIVIVILSLLIIGLIGYIAYDKILGIEKDNEIKNSYLYNDFSGTVFSDEVGNNYLILWDNGTYNYNNIIGNYIIHNDSVILNYIFDNGNTVNKKKQITLNINSLTELEDTSSNVKLNKVNQPTSPGGEDFYSIIGSYKDDSNNNCSSYVFESFGMGMDNVDYDELAKIGKLTYNFVKGFYNNNYSINVLSDGKILINFEKYISNISNAKNLQLFSTPGGEEIIYILTEDGKVYNYALSNIDKNNRDYILVRVCF